MLQLHWYRCTANVWCGFKTLNLSTVTEEGVYIIWHAGSPSQIVYVGQGDVAARLGQHRGRQDITRHEASGRLHVTWAVVPANQRDGVERYLADRLRPLVGDAYPQAIPIAVNLPWS
ncbi:hypothetical protein [Petrachloros mirabilis]